MARVKTGTKRRRRHKKVLKQAEGYYSAHSRLFYKAYEAVTRALKYGFRDRKSKKRDFRALWIQRINAAARTHDMSYSKFMDGIKKQNIGIDRKMLAELAIRDTRAFDAIAKAVRA